jgi:DNA helicase-2/ATP-dependent DNA helicase PcrA
MGADLLSELNKPQREAVVYVDGPLLILAGAGSGKTRVLTHRAAYLISEKNVPPYNILAVTFTNKAADEMKSRVRELIGPRADLMWISTFHSLCARMLREDIAVLGYRRSFTILDESDQTTAIKKCLEDLNISGDMFKPKSVLSAISSAKNELTGPEEYMAGARDPRTRTIAQIYEAYQRILVRGNALDFDDLIMLAVRVLREHSGICRKWQDRFRYLMVDEYQDTNHAQYVLVKLLASRSKNICVVGDDDQSIYEWRGADIRNILDFERDYPDAHVVKLEQNYRSTQNILDAANRVIARNRGRKEKSLWTSRGPGSMIAVYSAENERDEARFVADEIQRLTSAEGRTYRDFAVLYRVNAQSRAIEEVFLNRGMPYKIVGGLKFYERREIKDVLAYLRVIENPEDSLALERIINVPRRGIGDATLGIARRFAEEAGAPLYRGVELAAKSPDTPNRAKNGLIQFLELMQGLVSEKGKATVSQLVGMVLENTGYIRELEREQTLEAEGRIENLRELLTVTQEFEARQIQSLVENPGEGGGPMNIGAFLEEVSLLTDLDRADLSDDSITLMTMHAAKGLEFPVVFIAGMEENVFPLARSAHDERSLEEERRLFYVGITRAKDRLYLVHAVTRMIYGSTMANPPSRFLSEVPEDLLVDAMHERRTAWGRLGSRTPAVAPGIGASAAAVERRPQAVLKQVGGRAGRTESHTGQVSADYSAGDHVRHAKFGEGTVVAVTRGGNDWIITVAFPGGGIKHFAQGFAPMEKI